jgi:inner membrane protein
MISNNKTKRKYDMSGKFGQWMRESSAFKLFVIGFLVLLLLIPLGMVDSLISERGYNKNRVSGEIYSTWGESQTLQGPILTIPYHSYYWDYYEEKVPDSNHSITKKELKKRIEYAHFLPSKLQIDSKISASKKYRSIYEAVVYQGVFNIKGAFDKPDMSQWEIDEKDILYNRAFLSFGISDLRGVQERIAVTFDAQKGYFNPGIKSHQISSVIKNGVNLPLQLNHQTASYDFEINNLKLRGSQAIYFLPYAKENSVTIESNWADPSFTGDFSAASQTIDANGFKAAWKIIDLNSGFPQSFQGKEIARLKKYKYSSNKNHSYYRKYNNSNKFLESSFGVKFIVPVDYYQKSDRAIKYGILIIVLTFITFFFVEIFLKRAIHPFQYILVGFGLVLFFALLISISEHIGFDKAYILSSLATISSITLYSISIFRNRKSVLALFSVMALFYSFVYLLLQMQDYALVIGTLMLFVTLSTIMYISRNIDWYNIKKDL